MRKLVAGCLVSGILAAASPVAAETVAPVAEAAPAAAVAPVAKKFRVGYADVMKIATESDAGKVAKTHFEAKADRYKAQIDTKQKLLEKQKTALEAKLKTYSPEQRETKIRAYEKKVEEFRKLLEQADKEMKPLQEELTKEIGEKIEKAARDYGTANGFSVILEKQKLLYLDAGVEVEDVTEALIAELNKK